MSSLLRRALPVAGLSVLVGATLLASAPRVTFTDTKLKNGLRVIVSEDHSAPTFSVAADA